MDRRDQKGLCNSVSQLMAPSADTALGHLCREHGEQCWAEQAAPSPSLGISHSAHTSGGGRGGPDPLPARGATYPGVSSTGLLQESGCGQEGGLLEKKSWNPSPNKPDVSGLS